MSVAAAEYWWRNVLVFLVLIYLISVDLNIRADIFEAESFFLFILGDQLILAGRKVGRVLFC